MMSVKAMESRTIECVEDQSGTYHIPGVHNMQGTLCGFVDVISVIHNFKDYPCNCKECAEALRKIKVLKFPKGYWERKGKTL